MSVPESDLFSNSSRAQDKVPERLTTGDGNIAQSVWDELKNTPQKANAALNELSASKANGGFLDLAANDPFGRISEDLAKGHIPKQSSEFMLRRSTGEISKTLNSVLASMNPVKERTTNSQIQATANDRQSSQTQAEGKQERPTTQAEGKAEHQTTQANGDGVYVGETINREVAQGYHTIKHGETLTKIARDHLGASATNEEVQHYIKEIARVNNIQDANKINEGSLIQLPGHSKDGGFVFEGKNGDKHTVWKDGTERVENRDGTGHVRKPDNGGGFNEHHWGPRPEDNFELVKGKDGQFKVADKAGDKPHELLQNKDVIKEREKLNAEAERKIRDPEKLAKFHADMARFEDRAREQKLSPEQVAKTYREVGRILEAKGAKPLTDMQRTRIAEQVMSQVATPTSTDQGYHNTCNVTTVETRTLTRNPAEAAKLVADVTLTSEYTAPDGTHVKMNVASLQPDFESKQESLPDGSRSHASQIFQVTAVNIAYEKENQKTNPPGQMRYEQITPPPGTSPPDTGERRVDYSSNPPQVITDRHGTPLCDPGINDDQIVLVARAIDGNKNEKDVFIEHKDYVDGPGKEVTTFKNEKEMNEKLAELKKDGKLPVIFGLHTSNYPFWGDSGGGSAGGSGGGHVVTITDYQPGPPAKVCIDNQWGSQADHQKSSEISVHDLYLATRPPRNPESIKDLEKDVKWNREHNTIDTRKEFDLLRLKHDAGTLTDAQYDQQLKQSIADAAKHWKDQEHNKTLDPKEKERATKDLKLIMKKLPKARHDAIVTKLKEDLGNDDPYVKDL